MDMTISRTTRLRAKRPPFMYCCVTHRPDLMFAGIKWNSVVCFSCSDNGYQENGEQLAEWEKELLEGHPAHQL